MNHHSALTDVAREPRARAVPGQEESRVSPFLADLAGGHTQTGLAGAGSSSGSPFAGASCRAGTPRDGGLSAGGSGRGGVYQSSPGSYCFWRGVSPPLAIASVAKTKENGATLGFSFYSLSSTLLRDANPSIPVSLWSGCCRDYVGAPAAVRGGATLPPCSIGRAELVWASQVRSPRSNPPRHTHRQLSIPVSKRL